KLDEAVKRPGAHPVIPLLSFGHPLQVGQLPPQAFEGSCDGWIPPYSASPLLSPQDPSRIPLIRKAVLVTLERSTTDGARRRPCFNPKRERSSAAAFGWSSSP